MARHILRCSRARIRSVASEPQRWARQYNVIMSGEDGQPSDGRALPGIKTFLGAVVGSPRFRPSLSSARCRVWADHCPCRPSGVASDPNQSPRRPRREAANVL